MHLQKSGGQLENVIIYVKIFNDQNPRIINSNINDYYLNYKSVP